VRIGDVVHVRDGQLDEWWRIVPADMADVLRRWMSAETPMARALLGHRAGDVVRVDRPGGRSPVTILAIESPGEL
jgi:transcription elongation GreA/GreB family factor